MCTSEQKVVLVKRNLAYAELFILLCDFRTNVFGRSISHATIIIIQGQLRAIRAIERTSATTRDKGIAGPCAIKRILIERQIRPSVGRLIANFAIHDDDINPRLFAQIPISMLRKQSW